MYSNFDIFMSLVIREQEQSTHVHMYMYFYPLHVLEVQVTSICAKTVDA